MKIIVNGETKEMHQHQVTLTDLLTACNVEMPEMVSVQINGSFVDKKQFSSKMVHDNDTVDFLYFMGGGQL